MSHRSASSLQRERRSLSIGGEVEHEFREGNIYYFILFGFYFCFENNNWFLFFGNFEID